MTEIIGVKVVFPCVLCVFMFALLFSWCSLS